MNDINENALFKSDGFFWLPTQRKSYDPKTQKHVWEGEYYLSNEPHCISCRSPLLEKDPTHFYCDNCSKEYATQENKYVLNERAARKWQGFRLKDRNVFSLDLAPTHVKDEDEDDNFWIEARIGEKNGKRMAVIYFGEKVKGQTKKDYVQLFIDFDDEQIRFDKSNKNPMKLLGRLTAEFKESKTLTEKK